MNNHTCPRLQRARSDGALYARSTAHLTPKEITKKALGKLRKIRKKCFPKKKGKSFEDGDEWVYVEVYGDGEYMSVKSTPPKMCHSEERRMENRDLGRLETIEERSPDSMIFVNRAAYYYIEEPEWEKAVLWSWL